MSPIDRLKITFKGAHGDDLAARLDKPQGPIAAFAIFAHCFTCSKDSHAAARISQALTEHGIAVLRFDFTGLGQSGGEFGNTNFSSNVEDLIAAANYLRVSHEAPGILIGHSLGGGAVLAAAGRIPEVRAVVTIGAPSDPMNLSQAFTSAVDTIEREGKAQVTLAGRAFTIKKQFLDDIASQNLTQAVSTMRKALLVLHSPRDEYVDIENASRIFLAAKHPKSFVTLDNADHLLSQRSDAIYAADIIAAWASRYVENQTDAVPPEPAEAHTVVVAETGEGRFAQAVFVGGRLRLRADEPLASGGNDTGPAPYDFLLAALGTCTSMTLRLYAERKKIPLNRVSVTLRHNKIHAEDCAECETREGKIDRIEREIALEGNLDAATRQRLLEIADKCPVHRTLTSEIKIESHLKDQ